MFKALRRFWKGYPKCTHWWREHNIPGGFDIKVSIVNRQGKVNRHVANIYLSPEMPIGAQTEFLLKLCKGLDN